MITDELIARRPSGRTGLAEWYSDVFQVQQAEGLSMANLAMHLGVSAANLYHWHRRIRQAVPPVPTSMRHGLIEVTSAPESEVTGTRVESSPSLVIKLGTRSIEVRPGFDSTCLGQLVAVLESC